MSKVEFIGCNTPFFNEVITDDLKAISVRTFPIPDEPPYYDMKAVTEDKE